MAREINDNAVSKYSKSRFDGYAFQVLVSLLREKPRTDEYCHTIENNSSVHGYDEKGVNYFVKYYRTENDGCANRLWTQKIQEKATDIVDAVFSTKNKNLCEKAKSDITEFVPTAFSGRCGFSGVAAVRCGYQFVWYQLGYRYFTVGCTAGTNYTLTSANDGKYNSNCGQLFLFR
ncbi:hypothetical protein AAVH_09456 [Aphelenchoides avenae]|nr:hypothetical protein AAVH_09456 [Aphelenchus avenae]